jgi:hypothetical protein
VRKKQKLNTAKNQTKVPQKAKVNLVGSIVLCNFAPVKWLINETVILHLGSNGTTPDELLRQTRKAAQPGYRRQSHLRPLRHDVRPTSTGFGLNRQSGV